jgi:hypothetical protein
MAKYNSGFWDAYKAQEPSSPGKRPAFGSYGLLEGPVLALCWFADTGCLLWPELLHL